MRTILEEGPDGKEDLCGSAYTSNEPNDDEEGWND